MPTPGPLELVIILVIALLILGPGKLPDVGAALGKSIREFRKASSDLGDSVKVDTSPLPPTPETPATPAAPPAPVTPATAALPTAAVAATSTEPAAEPEPVGTTASSGTRPSEPTTGTN